MKKTIGVVGILVAAGAAWTAASWYTGTRAEKEWQAHIRQTNEQFAAHSISDGSITLDSYDRGIFSSTARYTLTLPLGKVKDGIPANIDVKLVDHIQHGPFPPARLAAGHFGPVMLAAHSQLVNDDVTAKWFAAAGNKPPFTADAVVSYGHEVDGMLTVPPIDVSSEDGYRVKFSGTTLRLGGNLDNGPHTATAKIDQLQIQLKDAGGIAGQLEINGLSIDAESQLTPEKLQVGKFDVSAKAFNMIGGNSKPIKLTDLSQHFDSGNTDGKYYVHTTYQVGMVNIDGKDVAGGKLVFRADSLDPGAVRELVDVYNQVMHRPLDRRARDDDSSMVPTPAAQERLGHAFDGLLAGNMSLAIDPLMVTSDSGESHITFALELAKPSVDNPPLAQRIGQTIRKLDLRVQVSKPQAAALLALFPLNEYRDAGDRLNAAEYQVDVYSRLAQASGAKVEGDNVIMTLSLADNKANFNGREIPLEEFVQPLVEMMPLDTDDAPTGE